MHRKSVKILCGRCTSLMEDIEGLVHRKEITLDMTSIFRLSFEKMNEGADGCSHPEVLESV